MEKFGYIISIVIMFLFNLFCLYVLGNGIYENNIKGIVIGFLGFILSFIIVIVSLWIDFIDFFKNIKNKRIIKKIKKKTEKNTFELILFDILKDKVKNKITECLNHKNKINPYNLYYDYKGKDLLIIGYYYQNFNVEFKIKNNQFIIFIDSPELYDYVLENDELENKKEYELNLINFTLDEFYLFLSNKIKECNEIIKEFIRNNKSNNIINGKTISKFEYHIYEKKILLIIVLLFGLLTTFLGVTFTFQCIIKNVNFTTENVIGAWIFSLVMLFMGLFSLFCAGNMIKRIVLFKKDKKNFESLNINGKCISVKLYIDGAHRSSDIYLKTITLYLMMNKKVEKVIILVERRFKLLNFKPKKIKQKIMDKEYNVTCLKYSRYVLSGANKIIKKIIE